MSPEQACRVVWRLPGGSEVRCARKRAKHRSICTWHSNRKYNSDDWEVPSPEPRLRYKGASCQVCPRKALSKFLCRQHYNLRYLKKDPNWRRELKHRLPAAMKVTMALPRDFEQRLTREAEARGVSRSRHAADIVSWYFKAKDKENHSESRVRI